MVELGRRPSEMEIKTVGIIEEEGEIVKQKVSFV